MMVHLSIMPIGENSRLSEPVAKAVRVIAESGLEYRLTPMGTLIKGDWKEVMAVVKKCHEAVSAEHDRVLTQIKIDDTKDRDVGFDDKVASVEDRAGVKFKK